MTTLKYNTIEYNVVYIDPTISEAGDGTTPTTALSNLPDVLVDKTCYILRRTNEEHYVDMKQSKDTGIQYIMFLGMPKKDSQFYPLLDEDVKTAWGNDIDKYTNIRMNMASYTSDNNWNQVVFKQDNIKNLICENCYFLRDSNSGSAYNYIQPMFRVFGNYNYSNVSFENCKFSYTQYDLEDDDFLNSNTDINTDTNKYPQYKCCSYMTMGNLNNLRFENCIVNTVLNRRGQDNSQYNRYNWSKIIYCANTIKNFIFNKSQYNQLHREYHYYGDSDSESNNNNWGIYIPSGDTICNTEITNSKINHIFTNANKDIGSINSIITHTKRVKLENIDINFKCMKDFDISNLVINDSNNGNHQDIEVRDAYESVQINNINCDNTQNPLVSINGAPLLYVYCNTKPISSVKSYIKNINFKFSDNPTKILTSEYNLVHLEGWNRQYDSNGALINYIYDIPYTNTGTTFLAENINLEAYKMYGRALYLTKFNAKTTDIKGRIYLDSSVLDMNKLSSYYTSGENMYVVGNSYLKLNEYEGYEPNFDGFAQVSWGVQSRVYVNKTNMFLFDENTNNTNTIVSQPMLLMCPNYIQNGQFFARSNYNFVKSWGVVRNTSTAQASLRFSNNNTSVTNPFPIVLGEDPNQGILLQPSVTGKHQITAYIATKNFTTTDLPLGSGNFWLEAEVPETLENGEVIKNYYNTQGKMWTEDNSVWTGDVDLTSFAIKTKVEVKDITKPINIKLYYKWDHVSGFMYLDPDIKLTKLN